MAVTERRCAWCNRDLHRIEYACFWHNNADGKWNGYISFICIPCSERPGVKDITAEVTGGTDT